MMYSKVSELTKPFTQLKNDLEQVLRLVDFNCDNIEIENGDAEERLLFDEYRSIVDNLNDVYRKLEYLQKDIADEGRLSKNSAGRYELPSGEYFTSGSPIEVLIYDDWDEVEKWVRTRVEHSNGDYYLYGYPDIKMKGLLARKRR